MARPVYVQRGIIVESETPAGQTTASTLPGRRSTHAPQ